MQRLRISCALVAAALVACATTPAPKAAAPEPACVEDSGCTAVQYCDFGRCVDRRSPCVDAKDCGGGASCFMGTCRPGSQGWVP